MELTINLLTWTVKETEAEGLSLEQIETAQEAEKKRYAITVLTQLYLTDQATVQSSCLAYIICLKLLDINTFSL
jgi:hypothetical protein